MSPNPYSPSAPPRHFIGRESERAELLDGLNRVSDWGEMMGPLVVITGPRGVGKTSLLRDVASRAAEGGFVVAWSSGVKGAPFLREVLADVTRALQRADVLDKKRTGRKARLEELTVELGGDFGVAAAKATAKLGAKVGIDKAQEVDEAVPGIGQVEDFLAEASARIVERGGAGLLLVIDELHAPLEPPQNARAVAEAGVLLNAIQQMAADPKRFRLGIIGAGLPQTKPLLTRAATFAERTQELELAGFDRATARRVLMEPAREAGVIWDEDAVEAAVARADGYPQALQVIGSAAWSAARPEVGGRITQSDLAAAWPRVQAAMSSLYRARWESTTPAERAFLQAMAAVPPTPQGTATRGEIATRLGLDTKDVSVTRQSLLAKGVIEAPARGELRFTLPGFAEFIRDDQASRGARHRASGPAALPSDPHPAGPAIPGGGTSIT